MRDDPRRFAPAAMRNRDAILDVLRRHLPSDGRVLEIASGSGEHIVHFGGALGPDLIFQPSDPDAAARASIDAWVADQGLANVRAAIALDASAPNWPVGRMDAVLCINMIHIAPWPATAGLIDGAARILPAGGLLYLYGPFHVGGRPTAPGNERFDRDLRQQNPLWGVRDLEEVCALATTAGFDPPVVEQMPANNLSLMFRRLGPH